jgi:hypothetical protein
VWDYWLEFWFKPSDVIGLHTLRVIAGVLFLIWLLPFAFHVEALFGLSGWFDRQAYADAARVPDGPSQSIGWSVLYLFGANSVWLYTAYAASIVVLVLFTLGIGTRLTAPLTWVVVASFSVNPAIAYEADMLLVVLSFYLAVGYLLLHLRQPGQTRVATFLGARNTWLFSRVTNRAPSVAATVSIRLLQVHWAAIMLVGGLQKLQSGAWWSGWALWYPLHPPLDTTMADVRELAPHINTYMVLLSLAAYVVLAWQIGFPFFAWRQRWRLLLIGGAAVGWIWTSFVEGLPLLGPAIFVGCLGYVTSDEWHRAMGLLSRLPGLDWLRRPLALASSTDAGLTARAR